MNDIAETNVWRHAKPKAAAGRCIGRTDVPVDPRKSKRLAHRIRTWARRHGAAHVVVTSSLRRGADTGRWLARWGWRHRIDDRLLELDFGAWDGLPWSRIAIEEIDAWCADFDRYRPGGGEAVGSLLRRIERFMAGGASGSETSSVSGSGTSSVSGSGTSSEPKAPTVCIVGHAGWISAAAWSMRHGDAVPTAADWPRAVGYGARFAMPG